MAKRKVTVTVDEEIVEQARALGVGPSLSAVVNDALAAHIERLARRAALGELLDAWDEQLGPVPDADQAAARTAFDDLDGVATDKGAA